LKSIKKQGDKNYENHNRRKETRSNRKNENPETLSERYQGVRERKHRQYVRKRRFSLLAE